MKGVLIAFGIPSEAWDKSYSATSIVDPPNKEAHANDLATQLEKLTGKMSRIDSNEDVQEQDADSGTFLVLPSSGRGS